MVSQAEETNVQQQRARPLQASRWHLWSSSPLSNIPAPPGPSSLPTEPVGLQMTLPQDPTARSCGLQLNASDAIYRWITDFRQTEGSSWGWWGSTYPTFGPPWSHGAAWTTWSSTLSVDSGDERELQKRTQAPTVLHPVKFCFLDTTRSSSGSRTSAPSPGDKGKAIGCSLPSLAQFNSCHTKILIICASVSWTHPRTTFCTQPGST